MKKKMLLSSILSLGLIPSAKAEVIKNKVTRIYLDVADIRLLNKVQSIQRLKDARILLSSGKVWMINREALDEAKKMGRPEIHDLQEILGPHIQVEKVKAVDIVLAAQDWGSN